MKKNLVFWQVLIFVHETKYRKKIISKSWTIWELWLLQLYIFSDNQIFPPLIDCDPIIIYYCMIAAPSILRKKRRPKCANFLCRTSCHELKAHCHKIRELYCTIKLQEKLQIGTNSNFVEMGTYLCCHTFVSYLVRYNYYIFSKNVLLKKKKLQLYYFYYSLVSLWPSLL